MPTRGDRRLWPVVGVALLVLLVAAGAGVVLRALRSDGPSGTVSDVAGSATVAVAPGEQPGPTTITLAADVTAHPAAEQVRALLQAYFDAINEGSYELWSRTVTAERVQNTGESAWTEKYRSTLDGSVVVHRLEPRPGGGLVVLLSFTSVQDPADAPPELPVRCLRWRVSYPLLGEPDELRLALASPNASQRSPC